MLEAHLKTQWQGNAFNKFDIFGYNFGFLVDSHLTFIDSKDSIQKA